MSIFSSISDEIQRRYKFETIKDNIKRFREKHGLKPGSQENNAHAHVLASAWLTYDHSALEARQLGGWREYRDYWNSLFGGSRQHRTDAYRDLYNNEVGVRIGQYAKAKGLSRDEIEVLAIDAYRRGHFVVSQDDPRIDTTFSGAPGDFQGDVRWSQPEIDFANEPSGWIVFPGIDFGGLQRSFEFFRKGGPRSAPSKSPPRGTELKQDEPRGLMDTYIRNVARADFAWDRVPPNQNDVAGEGRSVAGWGPAAYFWNTPLSPDGKNGGTSDLAGPGEP